MNSKNNVVVTLFLSVSILLFSLGSACDTTPSPNVPKPTPISKPNPSPTPTSKPIPSPTPIPRAPASTPAYPTGKCPDALKLGVCANVLNLVDIVVGSPPTLPCCSLIQGLVDLEAALCLCTAIKANVLGINLNVPVALSLVLNNCDKKVPNGFQCF